MEVITDWLLNPKGQASLSEHLLALLLFSSAHFLSLKKKIKINDRTLLQVQERMLLQSYCVSPMADNASFRTKKEHRKFSF